MNQEDSINQTSDPYLNIEIATGERITVRLTSKSLQEIDSIQSEKNIKSRSGAIRYIVAWGLHKINENKAKIEGK